MSEEAFRATMNILEVLKSFGIKDLSKLWGRFVDASNNNFEPKLLNGLGLLCVNIENNEHSRVALILVTIYFVDLLKFDRKKAQEFMERWFVGTIRTSVDWKSSVTLDDFDAIFNNEKNHLSQQIIEFSKLCMERKLGFCGKPIYMGWIEFLRLKEKEKNQANLLKEFLSIWSS